MYIEGLDYNKHFLSSYNNKLYVIYSLDGDPLTGCLKNMVSKSSYFAVWYNPRSGEYVSASESVIYPDKNGDYKLPSKPDTKDWVYLLRSTNNN
jgi:hypothetical protein